jgi:hypothetical protein
VTVGRPRHKPGSTHDHYRRSNGGDCGQPDATQPPTPSRDLSQRQFDIPQCWDRLRLNVELIPK